MTQQEARAQCRDRLRLRELKLPGSERILKLEGVIEASGPVRVTVWQASGGERECPARHCREREDPPE